MAAVIILIEDMKNFQSHVLVSQILLVMDFVMIKITILFAFLMEEIVVSMSQQIIVPNAIVSKVVSIKENQI